MKKIDVSEFQGPLTELMQQLSGENGRQRLQELNLWLKGVVSPLVPYFQVWKTVKIGVHKNLDSMHKAMEKFRVSDWAKDILGKPAFTLSQTEEDVELCIATVKELTGKDQATITEIFDAIRRIGEFCPAEVGPALREQYEDQLMNEWVFVAMEPIEDSDGYPRLFYVVRHDDGLWLYAYWAESTYVYDGDHRFVFRPRK